VPASTFAAFIDITFRIRTCTPVLTPPALERLFDRFTAFATRKM